MVKPNFCIYIYLGLIEYETAWEIQKELVKKRQQHRIPNIVLFLEHPHTITIGKTGKRENLLVDSFVLQQKHVVLYEVDRGGDITYHGPGQLIGYPILDLSENQPDVIWYLRQLEETIIRTLHEFQIECERRPKYTGVWIGDEKIAAIGVKISRWITSHGFALNIATDLRYFDLIVPCGIQQYSVTSMVKINRMTISIEDVLPIMVHQFGRVFHHKMIPYNHFTWPEINEVIQNYITKDRVPT